MPYPEKHYTVRQSALDYPEYTSTVGTLLLARNSDGDYGYISASNLQTTLDTNGLATDVDIAALQSQIGVSGSYSTQDKYYATNNGNGTNFKVGDDAWIGDVNISNTIQVTGVQTATTGYVKFGSGSATPVVGNSGDGQFSITGGLKLQSGSNKPVGTVVLNGGNPGTATITNSLVTSTSIIFLTKQTNTNSGNGPVSVTTKSNGSFTITSNHNGDTDTVAYLIINPA